MKEKQEVERILLMLTEEVAVEADIVLSNVEVVANLDFILRKLLCKAN